MNLKVTYYHGTEILKLYLYLKIYASISCTQYQFGILSELCTVNSCHT